MAQLERECGKKYAEGYEEGHRTARLAGERKNESLMKLAAEYIKAYEDLAFVGFVGDAPKEGG